MPLLNRNKSLLEGRLCGLLFIITACIWLKQSINIRRCPGKEPPIIRLWLISLVILLAGCSHQAPSPNKRLSDPAIVIAGLNNQLARWQGTPYQHGGMSRRGIDCSGFVLLTFDQRFGITLPRSTSDQSDMGSEISKKALIPGDLVFFKTGRGKYGLHVGIYSGQNQFIHASTSRGVTRSSLNNVYWRKTFWQARRL